MFGRQKKISNIYEKTCDKILKLKSSRSKDYYYKINEEYNYIIHLWEFNKIKKVTISLLENDKLLEYFTSIYSSSNVNELIKNYKFNKILSKKYPQNFIYNVFVLMKEDMKKRGLLNDGGE